MLESLVPAVASVEAEKEAADWSVSGNTVLGFDWEGVDEVAAVTAWETFDGAGSQGDLSLTELSKSDTVGGHLDYVGLVLATFELNGGLAIGEWHGCHHWESCVLHI